MKKIQILVGMIASGKSTYSKHAARLGFIVVNDDAIVNAVHGEDYTLYSKSLKLLYKTTENHIVGTALALNRPVLIDRGLNGSIMGRQRWISLARTLDVPCEAVVFPFDGEDVHANRRFQHDSRGHDFAYWRMVVAEHRSTYVEPSLEEGLGAVYRVSFEEIQKGRVIV